MDKGIIHSWHTDKIVSDTVENNKNRKPNRDQYNDQIEASLREPILFVYT